MRRVIAIAGGAGSGKTTLARELCAEIGAHLVDLDAVTADLVATEAARRPRDAEADVLRDLRDARYVELVRQARELRERHVVVMAAPFTSEIGGLAEWASFVSALGGPAVDLVWIEISPAERLRRLRQRGATRDAHLLDQEQAPEVAAPAVPHLRLSAEQPTVGKLALIRSHFDNGLD